MSSNTDIIERLLEELPEDLDDIQEVLQRFIIATLQKYFANPEITLPKITKNVARRLESTKKLVDEEILLPKGVSADQLEEYYRQVKSML